MFGPAPRNTKEEIIQALRLSAGVVKIAAEKLKLSRRMLQMKIAADADLRNLLEEIRDETLDLAEAQIIKLIAKGDREAIRFYLRCFGKKRGWIETTRIEGPNGGPVQLLVTDAATAFDLKLANAIAAVRESGAPLTIEHRGEGG